MIVPPVPMDEFEKQYKPAEIDIVFRVSHISSPL